MTNSEIFVLYDSLNELSQKNDVKLPAKIGYICLKNKNLLEPYYKTISESRMQIIQEYAEVDEDGSMRVPEDKIPEANDKLQEILDIEEEVDLQKININDIGESLPMDILTGLMPIIIEEEN